MSTFLTGYRFLSLSDFVVRLFNLSLSLFPTLFHSFLLSLYLSVSLSSSSLSLSLCLTSSSSRSISLSHFLPPLSLSLCLTFFLRSLYLSVSLSSSSLSISMSLFLFPLSLSLCLTFFLLSSPTYPESLVYFCVNVNDKLPGCRGRSFTSSCPIQIMLLRPAFYSEQNYDAVAVFLYFILPNTNLVAVSGFLLPFIRGTHLVAEAGFLLPPSQF